MKLFFLSCFYLLSVGAISQVKTNFTKQDYSKFFIPNSVPSDLKKDGHILMIVSPFTEKEEEKNAELKTLFETYYKGKFVLFPNGSESATEKVYQDKNIYKYMLLISGKYEKKIHLHYSLTMINRVYLDEANLKNGIDSKAIMETGLEDAHKNLNDMLIFYAEKLAEAKE